MRLQALTLVAAVVSLLVVVHDMTELHAWRADSVRTDNEGTTATAAAAAAPNNTAEPGATTATTTTPGRSPYVSFPKTNLTDVRLCEEWKSTTTVAPRFLLGGGKAGSSGLYAMLYQWKTAKPVGSGLGWNTSHLIARTPKGQGLCYALDGKGSVQDWESIWEKQLPTQTMGLDFCPVGTDKRRVCKLWELFPCEIKFVMLVRDPADRARSWFNDKGTSKQTNKTDADRYALDLVQHRSFQLADILRDAMFECGVDPRAILVVNAADGLRGESRQAQLVMDAIHDHFGLPRMVHKQHFTNRGNTNDERHPHNADLKPETQREIRAKLQNQTRDLLEMLEDPAGILQKSLLPP